MEKKNKLKLTIENNNAMVRDFIQLFMSLNNREPMESEIIDNLKDKIDIASIRKIIEDKNVFYGNREENDLSNII